MLQDKLRNLLLLLAFGLGLHTAKPSLSGLDPTEAPFSTMQLVRTLVLGHRKALEATASTSQANRVGWFY